MNKWLELLFKKKDSPAKKGVSFQYVAVILAIGVGLMLFGTFFSGGGGSGKPHTTTTAPEQSTADPQSALGRKNESDPASVIEYETYYENQLKEALEDIYGVSDVIVKVYVTTSKTKIIGKDKNSDSQTTSETDKGGGTRKIEEHQKESKPVIVNGSQGDHPLIIGTEQPQISGVAVVAGGADNAQVKLWIKNTVHSLFGVPTNRISVSPKKQRGNE